MKKITLEKLLISLRDDVFEVTVPQDVADRARGAIQRMVEL
jgi:quinolinate synthase